MIHLLVGLELKDFHYYKNNSFKDIAQNNWRLNANTNPFLNFKEDHHRVKTSLTAQSKETYDDIFKQLIIREDIFKIKEKMFEVVLNADLQRPRAEYKKHLYFEEIFQQQKVRYYWFENEDTNTVFIAL